MFYVRRCEWSPHTVWRLGQRMESMLEKMERGCDETGSSVCLMTLHWSISTECKVHRKNLSAQLGEVSWVWDMVVVQPVQVSEQKNTTGPQETPSVFLPSYESLPNSTTVNRSEWFLLTMITGRKGINHRRKSMVTGACLTLSFWCNPGLQFIECCMHCSEGWMCRWMGR